MSCATTSARAVPSGSSTLTINRLCAAIQTSASTGLSDFPSLSMSGAITLCL
jgi:hypothetical protein